MFAIAELSLKFCIQQLKIVSSGWRKANMNLARGYSCWINGICKRFSGSLSIKIDLLSIDSLCLSNSVMYAFLAPEITSFGKTCAISEYPLFLIKAFAELTKGCSSTTSILECDRNIVSNKVVPDLGNPTRNTGTKSGCSVTLFAGFSNELDLRLASVSLIFWN